MIARLALLLACNGALAAEPPKFAGGTGLTCEDALVRQALGESADGETIREIEAEEAHGYPHSPPR